MRYPASEKAEIIQLVEQSHLPAKRTLDKLSIPASHVLSLWTALPLQVDFDLICLARCKHLSGVIRSDQGAQMGNPLAPASTAGRPRGPR
jgi:hypothetical protein